MNKQDKTKKSLLKSAGVVGLSTVASRITGLARDIVSAQIFGVGPVWDAFVYAFTIPNLLRRLFGEGALSNAFIPVYAQVLKQEGREKADHIANVVLTSLVFLLVGLSIIAYVVCSVLLASLSCEPKMRLTIQLLSVLFPYIIFMALTALCMGMLNCHKRFFVSAFAPMILNIVWIVTVLWICKPFGNTLEDKIVYLAWGVLISGAVQCVVNYLPLLSLGYIPRLSFDMKNPLVNRIIRLITPGAIGFSLTQINIFIDMNLALIIGDGANSALWYGNRLMQFPLGIFGIAMGTALLPTVSHQVAENNMSGVKNTLSFSLRSILFMVIPASVGLSVLSEPIVRFCFERGEFSALATERIALVVICYSIGLCAYSGIKIFGAAFYSLQDTKTPVTIGVICMVVNLLLNLILMQVLREAGLALATTISGFLNVFLLVSALRKRIGPWEDTHFVSSVIRMGMASAGMGVFAWYIYPFSSQICGQGTGVVAQGMSMGMTIGASCIVYSILALIFGSPEMRSLVTTLKARIVKA